MERYRATLNVSQEETNRVRAPAGVDIVWSEFNPDKPEVFDVIFVGSDLYPEEEWRKTAADIRHEITTTFRNRVLADNITTPFPWEPPRILKIETFIDHPNMLSQGSGASRELRKAAEAATEVHDVEMTKEQLHQLTKPTSGQNIEDFARKTTVRQKVRNVKPDGRVEVSDSGKTEERFKMSMGIVDIG